MQLYSVEYFGSSQGVIIRDHKYTKPATSGQLNMF